ncbi:aspartate aminotransferase family protein [Kribbella sp.]|uniref:aspartate aminotransferase family protein n=1 Tax=Kribbella sp. TaxID=1871183 RepID=UPI002D5EA281|nr:aspartate aminotransferase family protein [Kribbella sp.]HZX07808.1 aspartate aminotransferase family protein [Kribbella sp.]
MIDSWPTSARLWDRAKGSLPGGVSTGMRASMRPHPLFFRGGRGPVLTDVDGNDYLDHVLGWGPVILGHGHPGLTEAVTRRLPYGATFGAGHELEFLAAEAVLEAVPGAERVLWSNTGSEADQIALRLARAATGRNRFVKMTGHYHGWSDAFLLGYRPDAEGRLDQTGTHGQSPAALSDVSLAPWGDLEAVSSVLRDPAQDIAAVFVEPVLCNSGVIAPPDGYLAGLRSLCDETGTLLVFDEVITGFRIALGGAVELYGVQPDLVVLAKALAGGYPVAAVIGRDAVLGQSTRGVVHAGTYNGNPVVLAAVKATVEALAEPGVYPAFEANGRRLADGMRAALDRHGVPAAINQVGPVVQVLPGMDRCDTFTQFLAGDQRWYDVLTVELLRRGVFALPGGRWYLSAAHTAAHVDTTVEAFGAAVAATVETDGLPRGALQGGGVAG